MLLHIFLILIVFAIIIFLLGFSWESFPMFAFASFLFFALSGLSMMIQIPYSCSIITPFSDDASRVLFILIGSFSGFLAIIYKFHNVAGEGGIE